MGDTDVPNEALRSASAGSGGGIDAQQHAAARERSCRYGAAAKSDQEVSLTPVCQYDVFFARSPHPMWIFNLDTLAFVDVNEAAVEHYGYSREEFRRMTLADTRPPQDVPALLERIAEIKSGAPSCAAASERVWTHVKKDGTAIKVRSTISQFELQGQRLQLSLLVDVTEQEKMRDIMLQTETQMGGIIDSASDAIIAFDTERRISVFNAAAQSMFRQTPESVIGQRIDQLFPGRIRGGDFYRLLECGNRRQGLITAQRADGEEFAAEVSVSCVNIRGEKLYTAMLRDITERVRAERKQQEFQAAIERAAMQWRMTFDAVATPIAILDVEGHIKRLNRYARDLVGAASYDQVLDKNIRDLPPAALWRASADLIANVRTVRSPLSCQARDEQGRTWDIGGSLAINTEDGEDQEWFIVVLTDISTIVHGKTMAAMGTLLAGVAHEVRNPLFSISTTVDTFEAAFGERKEFQPYLEILRGEVDRLRELMQGLLEFGKPAKIDLSPGSLEMVISRAVSTCKLSAQAAQVKVAERVSGPLAQLPMEHGRLLLLFKNLIENAIQHSPPGAEVVVEAVQDARGLECRIQDSGPGIRPEDLPRIFEPFFSRRRGGTGLGLSIAQRIAEEHGGSISICHRDPQGTLATVRFPAALTIESEVPPR